MRYLILILLLIPLNLFGQELQNNQHLPATVTNGDVTFTGDVEYNFVHGHAYIDSMGYIPNLTQNVFTKINTGLLNQSYEHGINIQGDSIQITVAGDYLVIFLISLSGDNNVDFRFKMFVNSSPAVNPQARKLVTTLGATNFVTAMFFWYKDDLSAGDWLSWHLTNLTNSTDPTIRGIDIYIEKKPEG